jgi:uncharacterized protein (TIGR03086 family)
MDTTAQLIGAVSSDKWSNPTPCTDWDVRALVNHLVFGNKMFAGILRGDPPPDQAQLPALRARDHLGDDAAAAYRAAGDAVLAGFEQPGVMEKVFVAPVGAAPGAVMLHLRITETLVHGWDLAQAIDSTKGFPDDIAEQELAFSSGSIAPDVPRTGHPFGPVQTMAADAPAIDRLAAFLGRDAHWAG